MTADISNFYLNTPLTWPEYIQFILTDILDKIIKEYGLQKRATSKGLVYLKITKGIYGLPQAGHPANKLLEKQLNNKGYY